MAATSLDTVIGRLLTDESFRRLLQTHPSEWLARLHLRGIQLTEQETAAFLETEASVWSAAAARLDPRLRRREGTSERARPFWPETLTARQRRVASRVVHGASNKEIAAALGLTEPAVKASVRQIFKKARVHTRAQLVRAFFQQP